MYFVVLAGILIAVVAKPLAEGAGIARVAAGTAAMTLLPAAAASAFLIYVALRSRALTDETAFEADSFKSFVARYARMIYVVNALILACYCASLSLFDWTAAAAWLGVTKSAIATGAVRITPLVASLILAWIPLHYADSLVRPFSPTLGQRLAFNIRQYVLTLMVPVAAVLGVYDLVMLLPRGALDRMSNPWVEGAAGFTVILLGYTFAPVVVVRLWKTRSLPRGPVRERLTALCRRVDVTFRDIRVWETPGHHIVNAAVMGIVGLVRYIVVSRTLLEVMRAEEVEAVFAHELGHAKHKHMLYYLFFAADFVLIWSLFDALAPMDAGASAPGTAAAYIAGGAAFAVYWGLGFGYVSRVFERDSDLFAADTIGDHRPFAAALMTIAQLSGISPRGWSWRHGSIASRVEFLNATAESPDARGRFLARVRFLKAFLLALGVVAIVALAAADLVAGLGR